MSWQVSEEEIPKYTLLTLFNLPPGTLVMHLRSRTKYVLEEGRMKNWGHNHTIYGHKDDEYIALGQLKPPRQPQIDTSDPEPFEL